MTDSAKGLPIVDQEDGQESAVRAGNSNGSRTRKRKRVDCQRSIGNDSSSRSHLYRSPLHLGGVCICEIPRKLFLNYFFGEFGIRACD